MSSSSLVEAIVLASLGGLIGVDVGLVGAWLGAPMMGVPFVLNPYVIAVAFGFSGIVGVAFGYRRRRRPGSTL